MSEPSDLILIEELKQKIRELESMVLQLQTENIRLTYEVYGCHGAPDCVSKVEIDNTWSMECNGL